MYIDMGSLSWREQGGGTRMHACAHTHSHPPSGRVCLSGCGIYIYTFYTRCECERVYIYICTRPVCGDGHVLLLCCYICCVCWVSTHARHQTHTHHTTHTMPACHASSWGTLLPTTTTTRKETARALIHGPKLGVVRKWL